MSSTNIAGPSLLDQLGLRTRAFVTSQRTWNVLAVAVAVYGDGFDRYLDWRANGRSSWWVLHVSAGWAVIMNVIVAQVLWCRTRMPVVACGVVCSYAVAMNDSMPFVTLVIAFFAVATRTGWRSTMLAWMAVTSALSLPDLSASVRDETAPMELLLVVAFSSALALLGQLIRSARVRGAELRFRQLRREEIIRTERQRLARELHDTVAHSLSGILMLAAGSGSGPDADHRAALKSIETASGQALRELGRMLGVLRAAEGPATEAEAGHATLDDLDSLIDRTRACGVKVDLNTIGDPGSLDPSVDHAAYRTVQECLANVIKHGGRGARARIDLNWTVRSLTIEVHNTVGHHDLAIPSGFGLRGIQERVDLVGGHFAADRLDTAHFRVRVALPRSGH